MLAAVPQKDSLKMLTRSGHDLPDDAAQADQVAHDRRQRHLGGNIVWNETSPFWAHSG
jgi:hypothetical protein